jgi:hypothetical protein
MKDNEIEAKVSLDTLKLALEALEDVITQVKYYEQGTTAITALRQAILESSDEALRAAAEQHKQAQPSRSDIKQEPDYNATSDARLMEMPKQEPVAFLTNRRQRLNVEFNATGLTLMPKSVDWKIPLYTSPPQRPVAEPHKWVEPREWRGLTDEEAILLIENDGIGRGELIDLVESKLKAKNFAEEKNQ